MRMIFATLALMAAATTSSAAEISIDLSHEPKARLSINGQIMPGDDNKLRALVPNHGAAVTVVLSSPGGSIWPALAIGRIINAQRWDTMVARDATCASACGLIWAAGRNKFVAPGARLGFHAAFFVSQDGSKRTAGADNALIGAYLTRLGYTDQAIYFMTADGPDKLHFLTPENTWNLGIHYAVADEPPGEPMRLTGAAADPPTQPAAPPYEMHMVKTIFVPPPLKPRVDELVKLLEQPAPTQSDRGVRPFDATNISKLLVARSSPAHRDLYGLPLNSEMPSSVGQCAGSTIKEISTRLLGSPESGSAVTFARGGYQVSYERVREIEQSRPGDKVTICLVSRPDNCPAGDRRGSVYHTLNQRTHNAWELQDAEHGCGGA